jgi:hypothetical protein
MYPYDHSDVKYRQTQTRQREFVVVESPIPQRRALTSRRPLALMLGSSATALAIWMLAVFGSASTAVPGALPIVALQGGGASAVHNASGSAPQSEQAPPQANKPALPSLLQSHSADTALPLSKRADGRTVLSKSPAVIVVYVPDGYYPQPAAPRPPTAEAAQQTAAVVQNIATANESNAIEAARALQTSEPQYAASLAGEIQRVTENTPRYNTVRQVLIQLDPALATRTQVSAQPQTQPRTQVQTQTQVQTSGQNSTQPPAQPNTSPVQNRANLSDRERYANVNALVNATLPAYIKMPLGVNEATLQVNTLVAPGPAFLFDQQQIKAALCQVGSGEVVSVYDSVPDAWELKTTFIPKDPVRWFAVKDAGGKVFYLPNYIDPVRDVQVGDHFVDKGNCNVALVPR